MHATHALSHWPLVGRYDEYAAALQVLTGNDSATAFGVLLIGESGVGKSTLASRLEEAVAETAHVVTVTSPSRAQPVMLGALAPLLTDVGAHADASPISVFQAAANRLARDAGGRPVVLRVEDGHLLDGASAGVLRMLAMSRRARLLVTSRPNPAIPDDLLALWKDGWLRWIDVAPLDRAETTLLLREALGGVVGRDTDRRMWEASLGNPLYLRELVRSALSRDELLNNHGVWTWTGPVVPGRLIELVTAELRRRPDSEREVLEIVSLAESLPLPLLFELADTDTVDPLVEAGMLVVDNAAAPPTVTLSHPVYGEAIRSLVPPGRRRVLRERVVRHLPGPHDASLPDLLRWVSWALEAGSVPEPELLVEAAALANRLQQAADGRRFADLALLADPDDVVVAGALAERARAHRVLGAVDRAQADLDQLHLLPDEVLTPPLIAHAAITGADVLFHGQADPVAAVRLLDDALPRVAVCTQSSAVVRGHRLAVLMNVGRTDEALDEAVDFLNDTTLPLLARIQLAASVQLSLARAGRVAEALRLGERYMVAARESLSEATAYLMPLRAAVTVIRLFAGDVDGAERMHADESDLDIGQVHHHRNVPGLVEGQLAMARGRWSEASGHLGGAIATLRDADPRGLLPAVLALAAESAVWLGDVDDAARFREEALRQPVHETSTMFGRRRRTLLWVGLARSESDAVDNAMDAADAAAAAHLPPAELDSLHVALLGLADGLPTARELTLSHVAERMAAAAKQCDGLLRADAMAGYARAVADGDTELAAAFEATLAGFGIWTTPPRQQTVALTRREQEIAPLAAAGISSRDIARRLTISTRTVESHLARIYAKLGITSRAELPAALSGR
ncbi:LuxR family transcriptional regulator [Jiangella sp. DSM 45060]|uniref:helix-turn-helix transcriptional regulator n=1 Tax=Jiangella sp. DSM 45060 TaxID=1798224 RepID=UPI00087BC725|nr:LuxR family transcriptional regulator [Jiangella sp. DSM 45060]SDT53263.1 AAA ATPase domain-containing protein [Jiangella sp. DSM 45060]